MNISWSRIKEFSSCRWRYRIRYEEYLSGTEVSKPLGMGTAFHTGLELYYRSRPKVPTQSAIKKAVHQHVTEGVLRPGDEQEALDFIFTYIALAEERTSREPEQVLLTEFPFRVHLTGDIYFTGVIDLVAVTGGVLDLWDHKLNTNHPGEKAQAYPDLNFPQLPLYMWALNKMGLPIRRATLNSMSQRSKRDPILRLPFTATPDHLEYWGAWLARTCHEIVKYTSREKNLGSTYCMWCDMASLCAIDQTEGPARYEAAKKQMLVESFMPPSARAQYQSKLPAEILKRWGGSK